MAQPDQPQKKPRPTLKTIAYMTGLGVTTVSRALHDAPDIGSRTKARVRAVAEEIGYRPNRAGVRLRTGKTHVISFILNMQREVLGTTTHLIQGLSQGLSGTPYHLIVTPSNTEERDIDPVRYVVETGSADGIILSGIEPQDERAAYLQEQGIPFVTHGRPDLPTPSATVDFDNKTFARLATQSLIAKGRKRIAIIPPPMNYAYAHHMMEGFRETLDAADLMEIPLRDINSEDPRRKITAEVTRALASRHRPDGLICSTVISALSAVSAIEEAGLRVGHDIDVAAKEPLDLLQVFRPEIMVISEDLYLAGREMAASILKILGGTPAGDLQILHQPES